MIFMKCFKINFEDSAVVMTVMKKLFSAFILFLPLLSCVLAYGQETVTVTGNVTDASNGLPVPFASIQLKDTMTGASTDGDGNFSMDIPADGVLIFSSIGYKTVEMAVHGAGVLNVALHPDTEMLDETIVVAYGTATRSSFTGSAAAVDSDKLAERSVANVSSALSGQVSGVQVVQTSGKPGSGATIRVRGMGSMSASNNPLYILDGVPYDGSIENINPADIESMTVLKDAAANAIYGARGANGVILITTKKGKSGEAKVTLDAKWGSNRRMVPNYDVIDNPGQYYELMYRSLYNSQIYAGATSSEAYRYADSALLDAANGGIGYQVYTVPMGEKLIGTNFKLNPNATLGYSDGEYYYTPDDWYDEIFGKGNLRQEYNATVSGSTGKINYYASFGYLDDDGIIDNSGFTRYTGRGKVDYQAKDWLRVGTNMSYSQATYYGDADESSNSSLNLFYAVNMVAPIYPMYVRDAAGNMLYESATGTPIYDNGANSTNAQRPFMGNSRAGATIDNDRFTDINTTFNGQWYAHVTPVEGLTLSVNYSLTESNDRANSLSSRWGSSNDEFDGSTLVTHQRISGINTQYLATYKTTIGRHNIEALAGYERYRLKIQMLQGANDHLYNPFIGELGNAGGITNRDTGSYTNNYMTEGILSRVQYSYGDKYFFSASYRHDASSRFARGHRWGDFGSAGGAWLISDEGFMSGTRGWLDMLKLKASWGVQGNDNLLYANGSSNYYPYVDQYTVSYSETTGEYSKTMYYKGNENITWETSYAFNTGLDFSFFGDRLGGTVEYFNRKTVDLLYNQPVPNSSGIMSGSIPTNVGSILNHGVELDLYGTIISTDKVNWSANINLTHISNKVLDLAEGVRNTGIRSSSSIIRIGGSLYEAYYKRYAGVDPNTGAALYYVDPDNGDWSTTTDYSLAAQSDCGDTMAKVYGGFGTTLNLYGFDFSAQFSYQLGGRLYDGTYQQLMHSGCSQMAGTNWHKDILESWSAENPGSMIPRLDAADNTYQNDSDRFLVSSDYLSINNVTIGYTFPEKWMQKLHIASLRVYATGDNLWVFSARKGLDPRMYFGALGGSQSNGSFTYSAMRSISGGITITF